MPRLRSSLKLASPEPQDRAQRRPSALLNHTRVLLSNVKMPGMFPKKFPGKMSEPMVPFFAAGVIVLYAINAGANAMMKSDEYKNDPRNPYAKPDVKPQAH